MCHLFLPPLFPPFPMTQFTWYPPLSPLSVKKFPCPTPLYPFPMKYPLWSLPNWMHLNSLDSLDSLAFAFVLSYIEPAHRCIDYFSSTLLAIFLEQIVLNNYLAEEGAFTQIWNRNWSCTSENEENNYLSHSIVFRTFQKHVPNKITQCDCIWPWNLLCMCLARAKVKPNPK